MSITHQLQGSRFELKYLIDEGRARAVRDYAKGYLVPDEYARPELDYAYAVHSLYLDSPDMALCLSTVHGEKNRFKLRIRFYDDKPASPVFCEIKRRQDQVVLKQRAGVKRSCLESLLAGRHPSPSDLVGEPGLDSYGALQRFCELQDRIRAEPRVLVSYMRQAFVSAGDNSIRVTFDRHLMTSRYRHGPVLRGPTGWIDPNLRGVVLELKFTNRFPTWMRDMTRTFNLERRSMAKYVTCAQALAFRELAFAPEYREVTL